jgi:hypothetical protein
MSTNLTADLVTAAGERVCESLRSGKMPAFEDLKAIRNCQDILPYDAAQVLLEKLRTNLRNPTISFSLASRLVLDTISRRGGWEGE